MCPALIPLLLLGYLSLLLNHEKMKVRLSISIIFFLKSGRNSLVFFLLNLQLKYFRYNALLKVLNEFGIKSAITSSISIAIFFIKHLLYNKFLRLYTIFSKTKLNSLIE